MAVSATPEAPETGAYPVARDETDRSVARLAHVLGIFTNFVGPLVLLRLHKRREFVRETCRRTIDFQLTVTGLALAVAVASKFLEEPPDAVAFAMAAMLSLARIVGGIMGAVHGHRGRVFRYWALPLIARRTSRPWERN